MYQRAHISTRNVVERFMGQWKKRFPCLWIGMRFRRLSVIQNVIVATAVLHNICSSRGDTEPPNLSRMNEILYHQAVRKEREIRDARRSLQRQPNTISNNFLRQYYENAANARQ